MGLVEPGRAAELLGGLGEIRALVVGDLMIDRYVSGSVNRVSPEAPVPVVLVDDEHFAIGGAGNVAANVSGLGATCTVAGCVGEDDAGSTLCSELEALGLSAEGIVVVSDRPTTVKTRVMARHQQIVRFDRESEADVSPEIAHQLSERVSALVHEVDVVIMEDYNKGVLVPTVIRAVIAAAKKVGIPTVVDPKRRNFFAYGGVTVFKPNAKELADALGAFIHPADPAWMEATRRKLVCEHLLLTLGEQGIALQSVGDGHLQVPTAARSVYDVSGAGDTVTAVVAVVLAAGGTPREAAVVANHAAAVGVGRAGVATVTPAEILEHFASHP